MDLVLKGGGEDLEKDTSYEEDFFYRRGGPNHGVGVYGGDFFT